VPIKFYEAEIGLDAIFSYQWLAENNLIVNPRRHVLLFHDREGAVWIPGQVGERMNRNVHMVGHPLPSPSQGDCGAPQVAGEPSLPSPELRSSQPVKYMLDLCSGTGSVGQVFLKHGYTVISVDMDPRYQPSILTDILEWDYKNAFPPQVRLKVIACGPHAQILALKNL
jgi:hypothetical protein